MDPNANLHEQETILLAYASRTNTPADGARLRELRRALKTWLIGGGFQPHWIECPYATKYFKQLRLYVDAGTPRPYNDSITR